jgi:hypothetical protein
MQAERSLGVLPGRDTIARLAVPLTAAVVISLACLADRARAATPVADGEYVGECCGGAYYYGYVPVAKLVIASGGHRLVGGRRGSYIACDQDGSLLALRPRHAARIQPDGSFSFRGRRRALTLATGKRRVFRFSVRGRFTSTDSARVVYSVRPERANYGCPQGPRVLKLHRRTRGDPPFVGCASQPGKTILSSSEARVFEQRRVFYWGFVPFAYACLYSGDQRVALGPDGFDERGVGLRLGQFRLAGPYLAYGCGGNWMDRCRSGVRVVDLRDGSVRRPVMPTWVWNLNGWTVPADVELKDNGSVAWILAGPVGWPREVGALDTNGQRLLDSGTRIDPASLTLDGTTVSWREGDQMHSAALD